MNKKVEREKQVRKEIQQYNLVPPSPKYRKGRKGEGEGEKRRNKRHKKIFIKMNI